MNKDEQIMKSRFKDYAQMAYKKNLVMFSDFLNLNEQNILLCMNKDIAPVKVELIGGYNNAERRIARFYTDDAYDLYDEKEVIKTVKVEAQSAKYAGSMNHRDYLGAVLNLGIDRSKVGDILIVKDIAYIFAVEKMAEYIADNLLMVKHTNVHCEVSEFDGDNYVPDYEEIKGSVASIRIDSVIATAFKMSRSKALPYIESSRVFVNGKLIKSNSYILKENDIVSVRGLGRFSYSESLSMTKKGRYYISIKKYV